MPFDNDLYPSRYDARERIQARRDPVVHSRKTPPAGVDATLARHYERDGFVLLENLFTEVEVQHFQREAERLQREGNLAAHDEVIIEPDSERIRSIFDIQRFSPVFDKLLHDTRLVNWARHLLDDDVYLHQSRLNYKPGFQGREFYWHSDFETWHVEYGMPRMRAVSMSIALTDNFTTNGPVMVIPGSQQHYVACAGLTPEDHYKQSLRRQDYGVPSHAALEQLCEGNGIVPITGRAGSVLLFDCNTMHGSAGNITPYPRNNLFFVYNAVSNRLQQPFSGQKPRPDYIGRRAETPTIAPVSYTADDYRP